MAGCRAGDACAGDACAGDACAGGADSSGSKVGTGAVVVAGSSRLVQTKARLFSGPGDRDRRGEGAFFVFSSLHFV